MLSYTPTPIQEIHDPLFDKAGIRVLVKREDLNHPYVSGNKWWKLKYNLEEAKKLGHKTLLTFGGAYSNHIFSTAAAAHELGFESIGIIRGEEMFPLNPTLTFAKSRGMGLKYITREAYRQKINPHFIESLHQEFGDFYLIPEGGTNALAVKGVAEFAQTLGDGFDYLCCAVGTGGTLAGLIKGLDASVEILGFPVLKGGEFLKEEVERLIGKEARNWKLMTDYHFGGYGKTTAALFEFIKDRLTKNNLPLDSVYTGKLVAGVYDLIEKGYFRRWATILVVHSGGLQNK
ncbi:MAG: 1-aminocyclopropane-1-carboxylate deaminase/D-cysteine desulfhydrase [Cyclobacteriaceae bacterium]|nr:1-aminocyclopropane-1-carboxylate deaminase/D-cysteine desulfhydrase [Cyclobacteriaceae bacterium]UYN86968.1 MAG: 1-aminocyclopropane-1-carboxylate deaminase/D-cysteine desulfhydrase [Cyclobacteriaceae bacterium]